MFAADVDKLRQDIKQLEGSTNPQDIETVQALQGTINWINDGEKLKLMRIIIKRLLMNIHRSLKS